MSLLRPPSAAMHFNTIFILIASKCGTGYSSDAKLAFNWPGAGPVSRRACSDGTVIFAFFFLKGSLSNRWFTVFFIFLFIPVLWSSWTESFLRAFHVLYHENNSARPGPCGCRAELHRNEWGVNKWSNFPFHKVSSIQVNKQKEKIELVMGNACAGTWLGCLSACPHITPTLTGSWQHWKL